MKLLGQHKNSICNSCTARPAPKKDKLQHDNDSTYGWSDMLLRLLVCYKWVVLKEIVLVFLPWLGRQCFVPSPPHFSFDFDI